MAFEVPDRICLETISLSEFVSFLKTYAFLMDKDCISMERIYRTLNLSSCRWKIVKGSILVVYSSIEDVKMSLEIDLKDAYPIIRKNEYVVVTVTEYPNFEGRYKHMLLDNELEITDDNE
jgi:hypothetical protein